jgi:hypothetical protein
MKTVLELMKTSGLITALQYLILLLSMRYAHLAFSSSANNEVLSEIVIWSKSLHNSRQNGNFILIDFFHELNQNRLIRKKAEFFFKGFLFF